MLSYMETVVCYSWKCFSLQTVQLLYVTAPPVLYHSRSDVLNHFQEKSSLNVFVIFKKACSRCSLTPCYHQKNDVNTDAQHFLMKSQWSSATSTARVNKIWFFHMCSKFHLLTWHNLSFIK